MDTIIENEKEKANIERDLQMNRLRVTRVLTKNEYNKLLKYEQANGGMSVEDIVKKFNLNY